MEGLTVLKVTSVVFCWLSNERNRKCFSHTRLGVLVQVCGGFSGHMACKVSVFVLPSAIA